MHKQRILWEEMKMEQETGHRRYTETELIQGDVASVPELTISRSNARAF